MRVAVVVLVALTLAACGGEEEPPLPTSAPVASATPPPADDLKLDLATAIRELETYYFAEGTYTKDETLLGPAFPLTVTVKEADPDGFYLAAYDDQGTRYAMIRDGESDRRICKPADPVDCPSGEW